MICTGTTLAAYCADSAESLREKIPTEDSRFPEGTRDVEVSLAMNVQKILSRII